MGLWINAWSIGHGPRWIPAATHRIHLSHALDDIPKPFRAVRLPRCFRATGNDEAPNQLDRLIILFFKHVSTILHDFSFRRRDTGVAGKVHSAIIKILDVIPPPILHVVLILQPCNRDDNGNLCGTYDRMKEIVVYFHNVAETSTPDAVHEKADTSGLEVPDKFLEAFDGTLCRHVSLLAFVESYGIPQTVFATAQLGVIWNRLECRPNCSARDISTCSAGYHIYERAFPDAHFPENDDIGN